MSRGDCRTAIALRVASIVKGKLLPYPPRERTEWTEEMVKQVEAYQQFGPIANDQEPDAPCILVRLNDVTQIQDANGEQIRTGRVELTAVVYASDSEQGYRDAENLLEAVELDLIGRPWIDANPADNPKPRYRLVGPWKSSVLDMKWPTFASMLTCAVEMPAIETVIGPDGVDLPI